MLLSQLSKNLVNATEAIKSIHYQPPQHIVSCVWRFAYKWGVSQLPHPKGTAMRLNSCHGGMLPQRIQDGG
jgi:hypothetical protein